MKTYARFVGCVLAELFPPVTYAEDIFIPGSPAVPPGPGNPQGTPEGPPVLLHAQGDEIPISDRFHPDFVAQLVEYDPENPPQPADPPQPAVEVRIATLRTVVQAHLDAQAVALGYDDIRTAVTYAEEPAVAKFQAEGLAMRAWRSLVWARCYEILAQWQAGELPEPDAAALMPMLPAFNPPA